MDIKQLEQGLKQAFFTENHRLVFWYDAEQTFGDDLDDLNLPEVQLLRMGDASTFEVKLRLELDDTTGKHLLYFPYAEPAPEEDWLLDIKLYSRRFYADRISLIFNDLGLHRQSLRNHLAMRTAFLASKARVAAMKRWVQPDADEDSLDRAMIATVLGADGSDVASLMFTLGDELVRANQGLEFQPESLLELARYDLLSPLIRAFRAEVGYPASAEEISGEAPFNFGNLLVRLLTTGFCESISDIPPWAKSMAIATANAHATARAFLSRWRDSSRYYPAYDEIARWVAQALRIEERIVGISLNTLVHVATFEAVEKHMIVEMSRVIPDADRQTLADFERLIGARLDGYWASRHKNDPVRQRYRQIYTALSAAIVLFALRREHAEGLHFASTEALYRAYEADLYRFDTAYRHYWAASRRLGIEILKPLDEAVEQCYANWFIDQLSRNWSELVEAEDRLSHWKIPQVNNQQEFFTKWVRPLTEAKQQKRLVVIISDAFRYEAAVELRERINEKRYSEAKLASQLGVVPSYTTLGMASLLPHQSLGYRDGVGDDVFVDNQSSKGSNQRHKILAAHGGMAITAEQLKAWSQSEGREALKEQYLVYVYHNVIDARGDSASTEAETFHAVEDAIDELAALTHKVISQFNTSQVIITADHGFLFQASKLEAADKTSLAEKPSQAFKSKKRYVIGNGLPPGKDVWHGSTRDTAGTETDTHFWIPKGANRFHFVGGARFVHGGIMPQEIVVPVLSVSKRRGEQAEQRTLRKVGVISAKSSLKMVNNIQSFELMQTDSVGERMIPITVAVGIYDGDTLVSSEEVLSFDSTSDAMSERVKKVRLSLSGTDFDRNKDYFLILKDKDLNTELERYRVTIDLAFTDDFF